MKIKISVQIKLIVIFFFLVYSCGKQECVDKSITETETYIDETELSAVIKNIGNLLPNDRLKSTDFYSDVKNVQAVMDEGGINEFYIVNFEPSGFAVISADNRIEPLLAYSENCLFPDVEDLPDGIKSWVENTQNEIEILRLNEVEQDSILRDVWGGVLGQLAPGGGDDLDPIQPPEDCEPAYTEVGPLLQTVWCQSGASTIYVRI